LLPLQNVSVFSKTLAFFIDSGGVCIIFIIHPGSEWLLTQAKNKLDNFFSGKNRRDEV